MSVFALKIIAIITMFIDHLTHAARVSGFMPEDLPYIIGHSIGRAAFVIFAYLLVNGFFKTSDRKRYLSRLILFAVISSIPFDLFLTHGNYDFGGTTRAIYNFKRAIPLVIPAAVYYIYVCKKEFNISILYVVLALAISKLYVVIGGIQILTCRMDIFYTLAISFAAMMVTEYLKEGGRQWYEYVVLILTMLILGFHVLRHSDYGFLGLFLIYGIYLSRNWKWLQMMGIACWCLIVYGGELGFAIGGMSALIPIGLYNGELGRKTQKLFYWFYPVHLTLIWFLFAVLTNI